MNGSEFALQAFQACCDRAAMLGRRLNREEWLEAVGGAYDTAHPAKKQRQPRKPQSAIDDAYLGELQAKYPLVNVRDQYNKALCWAGAKGVGMSRLRLVNWLNRAPVDPVKANSSLLSTQAGRNTAPTGQEPPNWREWVRANATNPDWANRPWTSLDAPQQRYIMDQLRHTA